MDLPVFARQNRHPIRLGFVPLSDCAPLAVARELGIFGRFGLNVELSRELGWSSVRNKMYHGELDAAQCIAGIAFSLGMGFSELRCEVAVPLILNLHGSAVTLSNRLEPAAIGHGEGLKQFLADSWKQDRPFRLAATHRFSSHHILLHTWLRRHGLTAPEDAEIVFLPPPLMPHHLETGEIDGYCVGEPWNSEAVISGIGWCPATSADLSHGHPEKVLLLAGKFLRKHKEASIALVAALLEACKQCQEPGFQHDLISILSMKQYTGASPAVLRNSMSGQFSTGVQIIHGKPFHLFHGECVNRPTMDKASWVLAGLHRIGALPNITCGSLSRIYREDIFHTALHCCQGT